MAKGGKRTKKEPKTVSMDVSSDDEMYDEQDKFHHEDRDIGKGKIRQVHGKRVEEVLNVEGDDSDDNKDDGDSSDFSDDEKEVDPNDDSVLPSKDQWGKKRRDHYKSGYVDNDYGGVEGSDEEELLQLEEADAVARQKQLDGSVAAAAVEDDVWVDDDEDEKKTEGKTKKSVVVEKKWSAGVVKDQNDELMLWLNEYESTRDVSESVIDELKEIVDALPKESGTRKKLLLISDTYATYLLNLTLYLRLKSSSLKKKTSRDVTVDEHPVVEQLVKFKKLVSRAEEFLTNNMDELMELKERLKNGEKADTLIQDDILLSKKKAREMKAALDEDAETLAEALGGDDEDDDGKRGIPYAIEKNKGFNSKKKKGPAHSRSQKRKKYDKALVRRRSQVPDVRREDSRYSGEARGIRVSTVKSTKLIA